MNRLTEIQLDIGKCHAMKAETRSWKKRVALKKLLKLLIEAEQSYKGGQY